MTTHRVVITDLEAFRLPMVCAVCDIETSTVLSYTQDHLPLVGPGIGLLRTTEVSVPYCEAHAATFARRFKRLRIAQGILFAAVLALSILVVFLPSPETPEWNPFPSVFVYVVLGALFLMLIGTVFCVKPFMYDVFFKGKRQRLIISSSSTVFMQRVIEANQDHIAT